MRGVRPAREYREGWVLGTFTQKGKA